MALTLTAWRADPGLGIYVRCYVKAPGPSAGFIYGVVDVQDVGLVAGVRQDDEHVADFDSNWAASAMRIAQWHAGTITFAFSFLPATGGGNATVAVYQNNKILPAYGPAGIPGGPINRARTGGTFSEVAIGPITPPNSESAKVQVLFV